MNDIIKPQSHLIKCPKCHGTGQYEWGAVVNGTPAHSGTCYSCAGKGHQTVADVKRNFGFNNNRGLEHMGDMACSNTWAEAMSNDLLLHKCDHEMALKACKKYRKSTDISESRTIHVFVDGSKMEL